MKILTIVGARPQFVKAAVLSRIISEDNTTEEIIVHTGQHYDANMSDVFFDEMDIPKPKYHLSIQSNYHGEMTGLMMAEVEKVAIAEKPDWILVYGDTNSTLAGALVAAKMHIKLAHVEAGLRSFNNKMPEEINRILTDRISDILFCPTDTAILNLENEGYDKIKGKKIVKTGDIMLDASKYYSKKGLNMQRSFPENFVLCTIHRAENTDNPEKLSKIFEALNIISVKNPVVLPLHPRTKARLEAEESNFLDKYSNIIFESPFTYFEMLWCLQNCAYVITDSGGLQKEAYFFSKKCLTLRDQTEWTELVKGGYNLLSEIDVDVIVSKADNLQATSPDFSTELYGKGNTAEVILDELKKFTI